jgi:ATP-binding cassette subfamily B protein
MQTITQFDLKASISNNRLIGLWRLMTGYRGAYLGATLSLGIAAISKTFTYLLIRYFVDDVLTPGNYNLIPAIALAFIGLALLEGSCTFLSGALAARTAEGIAQRLRNYLFDHIQRLSFKYHAETATGELIQRSTSDVDAVRRFFSDQAIAVGRIFLLFVINFVAIQMFVWDGNRSSSYLSFW